MTPGISVDAPASESNLVAVPDFAPVVDFAQGFPSAEMVSSAAALLRSPSDCPPGRHSHDTAEGPTWRITVGPGVVAVNRRDYARAERTHERAVAARRLGADLETAQMWLDSDLAHAEHAMMIAGHVGDWAAAETAGARADTLSAAIAARDSDWTAPRVITSWSRKSRARMTRRLAELDYAPLFSGGLMPAMVTLTYPGDWLPVAPSAKVSFGHVTALQKRFERAWGYRFPGTWKREFQTRGAPHYHFLMTPPRGGVHVVGDRPMVGVGRPAPRPRGFIGPMPEAERRLIGPLPSLGCEGFREWLARVWAEIVGSESCGAPEAVWEWSSVQGKRVIVCCERHRHVRAGTSVDYAEGARARDPKRLAIYFSKHGAYSAKEYQNEAPPEWVEAGSVGRFWGVWGLDTATAEVEVTPDKAFAASRTMRRWQNANGYRVQREVRRKVYREVLDPTTGELTLKWKWTTRRSGVWSGARMRGSAGFVVVNDGAVFASQLSRYLDQV